MTVIPLDWSPEEEMSSGWRKSGADLVLKRDTGRDIHIRMGLDIDTGYIVCALGYDRKGVLENPSYYALPAQELAALFVQEHQNHLRRPRNPRGSGGDVPNSALAKLYGSEGQAKKRGRLPEGPDTP